MRVWLIGADRGAIEALYQFEKNEDVTIVISARTERPTAM